MSMALLPSRKITILAIAAFCFSSQARSSSLIEAVCPMQGNPEIVLKYRFDEQKKLVQKLSALAPLYEITYGQIYPADVTPDNLIIHGQFANRAALIDFQISRVTGVLAIKNPTGQTVTFLCKISETNDAFVPPRLVEDHSGVIAVACRNTEMPSPQNPTPAINDDWNNGWILDLKSRRAYIFDPGKSDIAPKPGGEIVDAGDDFVRFCEIDSCDSSNTLLNRANGRLRDMKVIDGHGFFAGTDGFECRAIPTPPEFQAKAK
jgi:hypothetical protein